jgi:hypothetical protein
MTMKRATSLPEAERSQGRTALAGERTVPEALRPPQLWVRGRWRAKGHGCHDAAQPTCAELTKGSRRNNCSRPSILNKVQISRSAAAHC